MSFAGVFVVFLVSHHVGDYLLQTDWQARNKSGGLRRGAGESRRALFAHVGTYGLAFVPALAWLATETGAGIAVGLGVLVVVPHLVVDDGRLLRAHLRAVKHVTDPIDPTLRATVDQSMHLVSLFAVAVLGAALS